MHSTNLWRVASNKYNILSIAMPCFIINGKIHELTIHISAGSTVGSRKLLHYSQNKRTAWLEGVWDVICSIPLLELCDTSTSMARKKEKNRKRKKRNKKTELCIEMTFFLLEQLWSLSNIFYLPWLDFCNNFKTSENEGRFARSTSCKIIRLLFLSEMTSRAHRAVSFCRCFSMSKINYSLRV